MATAAMNPVWLASPEGQTWLQSAAGRKYTAAMQEQSKPGDVSGGDPNVSVSPPLQTSGVPNQADYSLQTGGPDSANYQPYVINPNTGEKMYMRPDGAPLLMNPNTGEPLSYQYQQNPSNYRSPNGTQQGYFNTATADNPYGASGIQGSGGYVDPNWPHPTIPWMSYQQVWDAQSQLRAAGKSSGITAVYEMATGSTAGLRTEPARMPNQQQPGGQQQQYGGGQQGGGQQQQPWITRPPGGQQNSDEGMSPGDLGFGGGQHSGGVRPLGDQGGQGGWSGQGGQGGWSGHGGGHNWSQYGKDPAVTGGEDNATTDPPPGTVFDAGAAAAAANAALQGLASSATYTGLGYSGAPPPPAAISGTRPSYSSGGGSRPLSKMSILGE